MKNDRDLHRYFDGELPLRRARQVFQDLDRDPTTRAKLEALGELRASLRAATDEAVAEQRFDHLWTRVEAGLRETPPSSAWARFWSGAGRGRLALASVGAALVLTMGLGLWFRLGVPEVVDNDCQIESIEAGEDQVTQVFTVENPDGPGDVTVVWVTGQAPEGDS